MFPNEIARPRRRPRSNLSWGFLLGLALATSCPIGAEASSDLTRRCSLSTNIFAIEYNATSGNYIAPPGDAEASNGTVASYDYRLLQSNESDVEGEGRSIEVRACWCTVYLEREVEYCPARFDKCLVHATGPVSCYQTGGGDTFVKTFWPVSIFWVITLVYALFFSEPGGSARNYMRRTVCRPCASPYSSAEEQLHADVERLLTHQPERAAFLYFSAFSRERQRLQQRQVARGSASHGAIDLTVEDPAHCNVLALKTKAYTPSAVAADAESVSDSVSRASSWLPSQCHREHVTLDDIDSQVEKGVRCAICLVRLNRGETVGDIVCGHSFHKDCLKNWLRRKNRCPLCQHADIAAYGYQANLKNGQSAAAADSEV